MPSLTIVWYAQLRDLKGTRTEPVEFAAGETVGQIYARLVPAEFRLPVRYALGDALVASETCPAAGDQLAFLPPVGGG